MPLTRRSLVLPASPPSVRLARSWVSRVLAEIGRDDLVDSAQLGVTELVTNALMHSRPPLSIRVRGTVDHPRIEVVDSSPVPPQRSPLAPEPEEDVHLTTFGRGLALVAMTANRWGSDLALDGRSKSVWFEPARDEDAGDRAGEVFVFDPELDEEGEVEEERCTVELLGMPAVLFGDWRRWFFELRRELRLLSISAPDDYPAARELTELLVQADRERRMARGVEELDRAIAEEVLQLDLCYEITVSTPKTMARVRDLLGEVFALFSEEHLLAVRPSEVLVELQHWYFTEFERQARGERPIRWAGPLDLA